MPSRLFLIGLLSALTLNAAELPNFLKEALAGFATEVPPDYAYTLTTRRGSDVSVERFDPSRPLTEQWTLLQRNQRPATPEENARYRSYRISTAPNVRATFTRENIDPASFQLVSETESHAEYRGRFRKDIPDPMLPRLEIILTVAKQPPAVEHYVLRLTEPFSPVLTVKMLELRLETSLTPPTGVVPALPKRTTSRFRGRIIYFKSIDEDIQTDYADFLPVTPFTLKTAVSH